MVPAFALTLSRVGLPLRPVGRALRLPAAAAAAMAIVVLAVDQAFADNLQTLLVGAVAGTVVYGSLVVRWWRGRAAITDLVGLVRGAPPSA